jgi:hypothetical protein
LFLMRLYVKLAMAWENVRKLVLFEAERFYPIPFSALVLSMTCDIGKRVHMFDHGREDIV